MGHIIKPGLNATTFLRDARLQGYGMQEGLFHPKFCENIAWELYDAGYLEDYTELIPVEHLASNEMKATRRLHSTLEVLVGHVEGNKKRHLPLFSVRVFGPGEYATTIHRNHEFIGPWAVGITLSGQAPFQVYDQEVLPGYYDTIPLVGGGNDPEPVAEMDASAGSAWTLYTANEQRPHSGGLVTSAERRELLVFYAMDC
jgi:hypothetical protein